MSASRRRPPDRALLDTARRDVDRYLTRLLPSAHSSPTPLARAMRYAVLGGGKRVRPFLTLSCAEMCGARRADALAAAAAVELVHAFSLVHDDLPCIDDDDMRRGRPTVHRTFGEAIALLAGDALLALAFETLAALADRPAVGPSRAAPAVQELARAAGFLGLVGGETADVLGVGRRLPARSIQSIHMRKTAALFRAAARIGGEVAGAPRARIDRFGRYGLALGAAFQIADDVRDEPVKPRKARPRVQSPSLVRAIGLEGARRSGRRALARARREASALGADAHAFVVLADLVEDRLG